jgi:hypothetical protein
MFVAFALLFWWLARRLEATLPAGGEDQGKRESAYSQSER